MIQDEIPRSLLRLFIRILMYVARKMMINERIIIMKTEYEVGMTK